MNMKKNMGKLDRQVRILIGVAILALYLTNVISGTVAIILMVIALVFILTSFISFCPLYLPFNISTLRKNKK